MLVGTYVEIAARRAGSPSARGRPSGCSTASRARSTVASRLLHDPVPGSLIANFHVAADVLD